jgi:polyisoprenoid-binding protein YceI
VAVVINNNRYKIQPQTSKIELRINTPIGKVNVNFKEFDGSFTALRDGENKQATSLDIKAESLDGDRTLICMMLRGEKFFDVENFPSLFFIGSSFEWVNDKQAILIGDMTIKNVTRKVVFYVELDGSEDKAPECSSSEYTSVKASARIRCSDFDLVRLESVISDTMSLYVKIDVLKVDAFTTVAGLD